MRSSAAQRDAERQGYTQVLWLDAIERKAARNLVDYDDLLLFWATMLEAPSRTKRAAVQAVPVDVHWIVECDQVGTAHIDPILNPGGSWPHLHTFGGNPAVHASSTAGQLFAEGSGCKDSADRSAYWQPTLVNEAGQPGVDGHVDVVDVASGDVVRQRKGIEALRELKPDENRSNGRCA